MSHIRPHTSRQRRLVGVAAILTGSILGLQIGVLHAAAGGGGLLDPKFGTGGVTTTAIGTAGSVASAVAVQADGKVVAAGNSNNGHDVDVTVARYTSSGVLDASFGVGGIVTTGVGQTFVGGGFDVANAIAIQADGKIVVAGRATNGFNVDVAVVRYTTTGALDPTFGAGGVVRTNVGNVAQFGDDDSANAIAIQPDGRIVVAGSTSNGGHPLIAVLRYTTSGSLDPSFGAGGISTTAIGVEDDEANALAIQPDGRIVVAGTSKSNGLNRFALARYTTAGALDASFGSGGTTATMVLPNAWAYGGSLVLVPDGSMVMAGDVLAPGGVGFSFALVRYTSSGKLDEKFGTKGIVVTSFGTGGDGAMAVLLVGERIVAVGETDYYGPGQSMALARYDLLGKLDTTFGSGGKVVSKVPTGGAAWAAAVEDGSIIVAGQAKQAGNTVVAVARFQS